MENDVFGNLVYDMGWKTRISICLYGVEYKIVVKAKAYRSSDLVTLDQENAYKDFKNNLEAKMATVKLLLDKFVCGESSCYFVPRTLLFQRNGSYALLLDDKQNPEGGVAVSLAPKEEVFLQNEYL